MTTVIATNRVNSMANTGAIAMAGASGVFGMRIAAGLWCATIRQRPRGNAMTTAAI
jgi:hypothetical protein